MTEAAVRLTIPHCFVRKLASRAEQSPLLGIHFVWAEDNNPTVQELMLSPVKAERFWCFVPDQHHGFGFGDHWPGGDCAPLEVPYCG
jgi:hypothetical protein